jgi:hypothetical protein
MTKQAKLAGGVTPRLKCAQLQCSGKEEGNLKFNSITFLRGVCTIKLRASVTVKYGLLKHAGWCRRIQHPIT